MYGDLEVEISNQRISKEGRVECQFDGGDEWVDCAYFKAVLK
jgi:hypothetical protein